MSLVKRTKLHDLLGNPSFPKKTVIIRICGNFHILQDCHEILGREMGKLTRDIERFSHYAEMKTCEETTNEQKQQMNSYTVI